jgi:hypothetical protein
MKRLKKKILKKLQAHKEEDIITITEVVEEDIEGSEIEVVVVVGGFIQAVYGNIYQRATPHPFPRTQPTVMVL